MSSGLSISTVYCAGYAPGGNEVLQILRNMGFEFIELNPQLSASMLRDIIREKEKGKIKISSIHSICPKDENPPPERSVFSSYRVSSVDETERKKAVDKVVQTTKLAQELGVEKVILHAGEVETQLGLSDIYKAFENSDAESEQYLKVKNALIEQRKRRSGVYFQNTVTSLKEILSLKPPEVSIALETRSFYTEIPTLRELKKLMEIFKEDIYYWHDTGHAALQEKLGFVNHARDYLLLAEDILTGIHFHDLKGLRDHLFPGEGEIEFSYIFDYLEDNPLLTKVIEIHPESGVHTKEEFKNFIQGTTLSSSSMQTPGGT